MRRTIETTVVVLIVMAMLRTWLAESYSVHGASMAPWLFGDHAQADCPACGWRWAYNADPPPSDERAPWCPNCDTLATDALPHRQLAGDWLLVDRATLAIRQPRRWEVVALRYPPRARDLAVKRLVGLPGEQIEFHQGNLWADGHLVRKTLVEFSAQAVLVHDDEYRPGDEPLRWRTIAPPTDQAVADIGWRATADGYAFQPPADVSPHSHSVAWLAYHHQRRMADGQIVEHVVDDRYGYNQSAPVPIAHAVGDLVLETQVEFDPDAVWWLSVNDGGERLVARIDPAAGTITLSCHEQMLKQSAWQPPAPNAGRVRCSLRWGLFDRQVVLALDGQLVLAHRLADSALAPPESARPLAIGGQHAMLAIGRPRVWRDLYLAPPPAGDYPASGGGVVPLGADEYYVIGDNLPVSNDSRSWQPPQAPARLLVGRARLVLASWRRLDLPGRSIQVPDWSRFRYIP